MNEKAKLLFEQWKKLPVQHVERLAESGSDRVYSRVTYDGGTVIATLNKNVKENKSFIKFSEHFKKAGAPVPAVFYANEECTGYLQEDLGNTSLLNILEQEGFTDHVYSLFKKSLHALVHLQMKGDEGFDYYNWTITSSEFGRQAIMADLLYFKYYFLDTLRIPYDKDKLIEDFDALSVYLSHVPYKRFMFRDFQSRNIMVKDDEVFFIDYQGGMRGALQYDVASLLWQAKANLPDEWKSSLLEYYMDCVEEITGKKVDRFRFVGQYNGYVLIRLLQVLGAYGFRGLFERKAHFLTSIPLALKNLQWFVHNKEVGISLPEFENLMAQVVDDDCLLYTSPSPRD